MTLTECHLFKVTGRKSAIFVSCQFYEITLDVLNSHKMLLSRGCIMTLTKGRWQENCKLFVSGPSLLYRETLEVLYINTAYDLDVCLDLKPRSLGKVKYTGREMPNILSGQYLFYEKQILNSYFTKTLFLIE